MNITVNEELQKYIDPLTENEYISLERSLLTEGCRDALVLWNDVLIDGHNRYAICQKHGIEFRTVQNDRFSNIDEVMLWMIDNQLSRRSVTDFQRGMLALRKAELVAASIKPEPPQQPEMQESQAEPVAVAADGEVPTPPPSPARNTASRQEVAKIAGVSSHTISQIEKIQKTAAPELIDAVRTGTISISAAAAVASLPSTEQVAAVAGGRKELRQAAKQVREQKAPPKPRQPEVQPTEASDSAPWNSDDTATLKARIAVLEAENQSLKDRLAALMAASTVGA